ncbi:MAG: PAS domain S-box protein [Thermoguttaceae bacterium]|jgi:PAS domain S-box-containing protein
MKVLLIAPDPPVREAVAEALRRRDHEVVTVAQAEPAGEVPSKEACPLVILDVDALAPRGLELCHQWKAQPLGWRQVLLVLTRQDDPAFLQQLLDAGADDYLIVWDDPARIAVRLAVAERSVRHRTRCHWEVATPGRSLVESCALLQDATYGVLRSTPDGKLLEVNPTLVRMLGYRSEAELLGANIIRDIYRDPQARERLLACKGQVEAVELAWKRKDGSPITVLLSGRPLRDASGAVIEFQGIVHDITQRKQAEEAVRKEQQALRQMLDLQERDRQVLAYELHDGFAQQLTGAGFYLQSFREALAQRPEEAWRLFDMALRAINDAVAEVRRLIRGLRPLALDESGVVEAVSDLVSEARRDAGLDVEFIHNINGGRLAPQLENAIFRVVQESLTNIRRHSQSDRVLVKLVRQGDTIRVEVRDWGVGFDPEQVERGHFGLEGILQRARLLGGHAQVHSEIGHGTRVTIELPWIGSAG